ncbi:unnamed protein product, partial [Brenthis ino]
MLKIGGGAALLAAIVAVFVVATQGRDPDLEALEQEGREYIMHLDKMAGVRKNRASLAEWAYTSNITEENEEKRIQVQLELSKQEKQAWEETKMYKWQDFQDFSLRRMFKKYTQLGVSALPDDKYKLLMQCVSGMESNYATSKICDYKNATKCDLALEPDITEIFTKSQDPDELKHTWVEWHKAAGAKARQNFTQYVQLDNEAAKLNGFKDVAEWWQSEYEVPDFEQQLAKLWEDVKPLYQQLHAYVRKRLRDKYGEGIVSARGPIPAHLLGNMWAQTWTNIESFTRPYPDKKEIDITKTMKDQNYTPLKMFQMSDEFFRSLNLTAMPEKFWKNSIIEKPTDREIVCHASAWDFYDGEDFRIKMCTTVDAVNLKVIHHEMGHIQYYLQYRHLPFVFRNGANPGFHEAVGDTIALSVSSPKHLRRVGLISGDAEDEQTEINQLYKMGIDKIVFLPFAYTLDLFRYGVFRGNTTPDDYNCHYWRLRDSLQGVEPPVPRSEEDFDAAAKYHVSADVEYARYYVSFIIQFQFHRALCQLAGEYAPGDVTRKLVDCDIYQSVHAGNALANMLKMGSSKPWPDAMEALTGQRAMRADGLLEYFRPLHEWLEAENQRTGEFIGWEPSKIQYCSAEQRAALEAEGVRDSRVSISAGAVHRTTLIMLKIFVELALVGAIASVFIVAAQGRAAERAAEEAAGREYMRTLDEITSKAKNKRTIASWNYESNITAYNEEKQLQVALEVAEEEKENWKETMTYLWHEFEDPDLRRMFEKYSRLGTSALPEDLNQRLIQAINNMKTTYAKATICDYKDRSKCDLYVEPDVTNVFSTSDDPEELKYTWLEWHKVAGAASKGNFTEYVNMNNEAAKLNGYDNVAEWWISEYEEEDSEDQFAALWAQIKPLYQQIHAYVRRHLRLKYGDDVVSAKGPIPAHLLGNIWAQTWNNVEKFTRPYPEKPEVDVTAALIAQNYTPLKIFKTAEEFFKSLNLSGMPDTFWENSIIEKPNDGRDMVCHASAWDFFDGEDFRIKQCTTITNAFFKTTHHEMGHIQYYLQYKDLPVIYRAGANPGFHEAVGDVMALSVSTPKHLRVLGLLEDGPDDLESNINQLYKMILDKIVFLPFAYLLDLYRYGVFRGTTTESDYNCHFWKLREAFQGVEPPAPRSEADFDPAAKYHVSADVEYMRYYISFIIQFQFHRSLCQIAGEYSPGDSNKLLSNCDIYRSTAAGNAFGKMLQLGSSKPWPDAMEVLTGQRRMDASGVLEYFEPLHEWLKAENERTGEYIGWEPSTVQYCTPEQKSAMADSEFLKSLNKRVGQ